MPPKTPLRMLIVALALLLCAPAGTSRAAEPDPAWQCWGPDLVDPCRNPLHAISIVPGTDGAEAWAIGDKGTILHWQAGVWRRVASPLSDTLLAIEMVSPTDGWITGASGAALRWDGSAWQKAKLPTSRWFSAITRVPGSAEYWTAGSYADGGEFHYWDGATWKTKGSGSRYGGVVKDITLLAADDGWAVGFDTIGQSFLRHWDGNGWTAVAAPPKVESNGLYGVSFAAPDDGWAVGEMGTVLHWDGAAWVVHVINDEIDWSLRAVQMLSATDGWIVSDFGTILRWDGGAWMEFPSPVEFSLYKLAMLSPMEGWAVGDGGVVLHWNGDDWQTVIAPEALSLTALSISPGSQGRDAWAIGDGQTVRRWDGQTWQNVNVPLYSLGAISMLSPTDGWLAGYDKRGMDRQPAFARWDGQTWSIAARPGANAANAFAFLSPQDG